MLYYLVKNNITEAGGAGDVGEAEGENRTSSSALEFF